MAFFFISGFIRLISLDKLFSGITKRLKTPDRDQHSYTCKSLIMNTFRCYYVFIRSAMRIIYICSSVLAIICCDVELMK